MTAKEKQKEFIKSYLKPSLKQHNYLTSGQTWWKDLGPFFIVINLQNSSWNSQDDASFCFNIGIALTNRLKDPKKKKATYFDCAIHLRENDFLSKKRSSHKYRGGLGYAIYESTILADFINEIKLDFELDIFPVLENIKTLKDCLTYFGKIPFRGESLKRQIEESNLPV